MNQEEKLNALKQALTLIFGMLTVVAPQLATAEQYSTLTTAILTIVPACVTAYSVIWSIYAHWNMKKVPENATALVLPPGAVPPVGATINLTPMTGVAKVVGALLVGFLVLHAVSPASAQIAVTGNLAKDLATDRANLAKKAGGAAASAAATSEEDILAALAKPFQDLATFIGDDIDAAVALSTTIPALQDGNGQQCWMGMQQFSAVVKAHPVPLTLKVATDLEALRLAMMAANNLCANPHCTQVFADLANGVQQLSAVNLSVPIPSLNSVCSKVPQIAVVAPVAANATPVPAATTK